MQETLNETPTATPSAGVAPWVMVDDYPVRQYTAAEVP